MQREGHHVPSGPPDADPARRLDPRHARSGVEADAILRKCVHCGFCLATCPTYNLLGDELDSPRGRIYLMKQMLEGAPVTRRTQLHLDRCLTCRACETTCPSGVEYGKLAGHRPRHRRGEGARANVATASRRWFLQDDAATSRRSSAFALLLGRMLRSLLPKALAAHRSQRAAGGRRSFAAPFAPHGDAGRMRAAIDRAFHQRGSGARARPRRDLARRGAGGRLLRRRHASTSTTRTRRSRYMKRNIDAWWPHVEAGAEAIVITASGCGTMVKDYGHLLAARSGRICREGRRASRSSRATSRKWWRPSAKRSPAVRDGRRAGESRLPVRPAACSTD